MALKNHALTANLPESIIFDAGVLYKNFVSPAEPGEILGATRGGSEFNLNAEMREVEVDGAPGPVKGLKRFVRVAPEITINLLSLTKENILMAIPGAKATPGDTEFEGYDVITSGQIQDEHYFDNLLSEVDVLVMDDLGAEVGNIDTDKTASDFVGRILRNITTSRQDKVTIYTTNLSSADLKHVYDEKTVSRMFRRLQPIVFKETQDMRQKDWGF